MLRKRAHNWLPGAFAFLLALATSGPLALARVQAPQPTPAKEGPRETSAASVFERKVSVMASNAPIRSIVQQLHKAEIPVSFVDPGDEYRVSLDLKDASVRAVLEVIVKQVPSCRFGVFGGHLVLYPDTPRWRTVVRGIEIRDEERLKAVDQYLKYLRRNYPAFKEVSLPWKIGWGSSRVWIDHVSVTDGKPILEHLGQLLGDNPKVLFWVATWPPNRVLGFNLGEVR